MLDIPQRLAGQVAVVTGAAAGIGAATARRLASEGAKVALADLDAGAAQRVADALEADGRTATAHGVDVPDTGQVDALIAAVAEAHGRLDALVNNAGITRDELLFRLSEEDWDAVLDPEEHRRRAAERTPLRRVGIPEDVAAVVAFLAGGDAAYVTGQTIEINGGAR